MEKLAILGGPPVIPEPLPEYQSVGDEELRAVTDVIKSGCLSDFYGSWNDKFFGGPKIRAFEEAWSERFGVKHSITMNSATSGLYAAMGAIGIGPGDEVIVPPYTMSATAVAPLIYGGIPVFADIDPDYFCIDPKSVRNLLSPRTKAIIAVNLFGHPAQLRELKTITDEHGLALIEDNAQGPLAEEDGRLAGTVGDIGIFSLNYHKHVHTGEGGMCVTNDDDLALRLQMIRNHGENVTKPAGTKNLTNLVGFNFRLNEMSAAIGIVQLQNIEPHVRNRVGIAEKLSEGIRDLEGITPPLTRPGCRHVYYVWAPRFNEETVGLSREMFSQALAAEGFPHFNGYIEPLYLLPLFQRKIAIGSEGYPFNLSSVNYDKGICPVVERMYEKELICFLPCTYDLDDAQIKLLVEAFRKVYRNRRQLSDLNGLPSNG